MANTVDKNTGRIVHLSNGNTHLYSTIFLTKQIIRMANWIKYQTILEGRTVKLIPLDKSNLSELELLAKDKRIWEFYLFDGTDSNLFHTIYNNVVLQREKGIQFPYVIYNKIDNKIIGSTSYLDIQEVHKKLEIGLTWLHPEYWGTDVNIQCKLLLLTHCFEELGAVRVQLKTDENNLRSRRAIEKIGGQFEGILRNEMIRNNKTKRNSAFYSFIDDEWRMKKQHLLELLKT
jgi:RimJ/RimL family protein N-acetyltransferase